MSEVPLGYEVKTLQDIEDKLKVWEEAKKDFDSIAEKIQQSSIGLNSLLSQITQERVVDYSGEDNLFFIFHGYWKDDIFVVPKDQVVSLNDNSYNCYQERDITFTRNQYEEMEQQVLNFFSTTQYFADYNQWSGYRGIQWGFHNNEKIKAHLKKLASEGNIYCRNYLIFDALQVAQHHPDVNEKKKALELARDLYPSLSPIDSIYKAILFDDYSEMVERENPFEDAWVWDLSPVKVLLTIKENNIKLEEPNKFLAWLVEKTLDKD